MPEGAEPEGAPKKSSAAKRQDDQGECEAAEINCVEAAEAAKKPRIQTKLISLHETPRVTFALYSSGSRMARYWSTPEKYTH